MAKESDEEFWRWCLALKPCRYCGNKFVGPVCVCERPRTRREGSK